MPAGAGLGVRGPAPITARRTSSPRSLTALREQGKDSLECRQLAAPLGSQNDR